MSIGSNIRRIRVARDLTQEEFGKIVGVSAMAVSQWENDRAVPRMGAVQAIADHFGLNKGEIIDDEPTDLPDGAMLPSDARPAYAPLLGRVHAGDACEPDVIDDRIPIPYEVREVHPRGYFLEVEGGCMNRVYPEGCHIYIDPAQQPRNGSVAVVSIDGADYVMRRLYNTGRTVVLSPDSWDDCYEDIVITVEDGRTVEYVGTVVWFQPAEEME
ncbi:MAG: LexA family transcriptional regulator [Collinsella aerofaciens]|nr:LexA family transcriptional regulator [Collinsella aerofaciens]